MSAFNFKVVKSIHSSQTLTSNPVEFFYELSHPGIRELYPSQKEILEKWYKQSFNDNEWCHQISLDTWAWKTLVGIYIAESIRRSTGKKVLYVCADNYLVEQTKWKAKLYGINASSYYSGKWDWENEFLQNDRICITNYDALLVNRSIFRKYASGLGWIIFDDSHNLFSCLEKQFSVTITKPAFINEILWLFENNEEIKEQIISIRDNDRTVNLLIPPHLFWKYKDEIRKKITDDSDIIGSTDFSFYWDNIKNSLDSCLLFCAPGKIEISMLLPDVRDKFYLSADIKKVFLSATTNNSEDFIRSIGINPSLIYLDNPTYRPDRLFIFSKIVRNKVPDFDSRIINEFPQIAHKALILTASRWEFEKFKHLKNIEFLDDTKDASLKIESFKKSDEWILVVANRYEWIDMDGDICHFLMITDIFNFSSLKTKFFAGMFGKTYNFTMRSVLASKISQAFGRTTRSATDFSAIILLGEELNSVLIDNESEILFTKELAEDLRIGKELSSNINNFEEFLDLMRQHLDQEADYKEYLQQERTKERWYISVISEDEKQTRINIASIERELMNLFFEGKYSQFLVIIEKRELEKLCQSISMIKVFSLYLNMASYCCLKLNKWLDAQRFYERAVGLNSFLWNASNHLFIEQDISKQLELMRWIWRSKDLVFSGNISHNIFESNIEELWRILWFESIRPEKKKIWTLDNLWISKEDNYVIGLESKSEKTSNHLNQSDIGQSLSHLEWIKQNYGQCNYSYYIIGEINSITNNATPSDDILLLSFSEIDQVYNKIKSLQKTHSLYSISQKDIERERLNIKEIFSKNEVWNLPKKQTN